MYTKKLKTKKLFQASVLINWLSDLKIFTLPVLLVGVGNCVNIATPAATDRKGGGAKKAKLRPDVTMLSLYLQRKNTPNHSLTTWLDIIWGVWSGTLSKYGMAQYIFMVLLAMAAL